MTEAATGTHRVTKYPNLVSGAASSMTRAVEDLATTVATGASPQLPCPTMAELLDAADSPLALVRLPAGMTDTVSAPTFQTTHPGRGDAGPVQLNVTARE